MPSKFALVSIFLFVSAVLAGYQPEQQQPRPGLLRRAEEAIDGTLDGSESFWSTWAGAALMEDRGTFTSASGMFAIPYVLGNSTLSIGVGLDSQACNSMAWAEIYVTGTDSGRGISVKPWFKFWNSNNTVAVGQPLGVSLDISRGDKVNLTVQAISPTKAFFVIDNVTTRKSWSDELVTNPEYPLCGESVEWFTTIPRPDDIPHATVTFTNFSFGVSEFSDMLKEPFTKFQQPNVSVTFEPQDGSITIRYGG